MSEMTVFQQKMTAALPHIEYRFDEPMSRHTSFRIGGPAEVMAFPKSADELAKLLKMSAFLDCKTAIIGAGTNILAPDEGIEGLVICLKDCLTGMEQIDSTHIRVAAGVSMARAAVFAAGLNLGGLEFAHGIPGTVGGGVYMNAGAYGGEIKDVCQSVSVMYPDGSVVEYSAEEMEFSYRHSRLEKENGIVISAVFTLTPKPEAEVREQMQELFQKRKTSQPLELPSAGSAFKRPVGGYAAALIDQVGLKGFTVGGAQVSTKHAGFVVNVGGATAKDVEELLKQVAEKVMEHSGIALEPEIRIW
ncbi:MAG: UDP-N-acetylmuramate dehydrogenase [Oscillospiraceae bacterium]|nr:UDP-N-acetylmuramate dehydrogenase [Oscillospiraceae bacterium]